MNNEIAPVLDMLEELKQECKAISMAQVELRTTIAEQLSNPKGDSIKTQENCANPSLTRNSKQDQRTSTFCFGGTLAVEQETRPEV